MNTRGLLEALDQLYQNAVTNPSDWDEAAFVEWLESTLADNSDREVARQLRTGVRLAIKAARYWRSKSGGPKDWRVRVDEALGSRAWEPGLAIAELGLNQAPDQELFAEVQLRFRAARFRTWQEGVSYSDWLAGRDQPGQFPAR